jgi:membrane-associated protease RseP (regulator of RpoE activity)
MSPLRLEQQQATKKVVQTRTTSTSSKTELQAALSLAAAASPIGAVSVLAFIVLIHEAGHYTAARHIFGMKVEEFSIGFGPRITGFTAWGNEFNLRALPLGGFVRFPENYNTTEYQIKQELRYEAGLETRQLAQALRKEQGGVWNILNFASFGTLEKKMFQELKEEAKQVEIQAWEEQVAKQTWWSKTFGGKKELSPPRLEDDTDPEADYEIEYYDDPDLLQNRPWFERAVVLSAGVFMNLVLSFTLYFGVIGFGSGIPQPVFAPGVIVNAMPRQDGPAFNILQKGDIIVSVNGTYSSHKSEENISGVVVDDCLYVYPQFQYPCSPVCPLTFLIMT